MFRYPTLVFMLSMPAGYYLEAVKGREDSARRRMPSQRSMRKSIWLAVYQMTFERCNRKYQEWSDVCPLFLHRYIKEENSILVSYLFENVVRNRMLTIRSSSYKLKLLNHRHEVSVIFYSSGKFIVIYTDIYLILFKTTH